MEQLEEITSPQYLPTNLMSKKVKSTDCAGNNVAIDAH